MSTDLAQFARFPSPRLPAQPDAPVPSPKDDPGPKGNDVASPPTAIDAGFVSTTTREDQTDSAPQEPSRDLDYRCLVLAKETQMLEVQKLQHQLELAKLQVSSGLVVSGESNPTAARTSDQTKSLGDLRAPQRTMFPQQWPHIFAPGEPKLYNELTIAEFTAGYLAIVEKCPEATQKSLFLRQLADLMSLACSYQWSAIHAFHYKVLRALEMGLVKWGDSFESFKQPFFIPTNLLPSMGSNSQDKLRKNNTARPAITQQPSRHQICDDWSWYDNCSSENCPKLHVCIVCKRPDHQAKNCPKRKFDIPARRQEPTPKSS